MGSFRRLFNPCLVPVSAAASSYAVPADVASALAKSEVNSFLVVNSNACWVRLQGFQDAAGRSSEGNGWLFGPGLTAVWGTQKPKFMSAIAVERPGYPLAGLTYVPLEVCYGVGD